MVSQTAFQFTLDFLTSKPVVVVSSAEQVSSDAGLLPFRQLDERLGLTRQFAEALEDRRNENYVDHSLLEMVRMRVYGILADYADQNDHDVMRSDPVFKLLCDRSLQNDDLASQPCTWRTRFIKVAARVRESTRRVVVELSSSWPYLDHFQEVLRRPFRRISIPAKPSHNSLYHASPVSRSRGEGGLMSAAQLFHLLFISNHLFPAPRLVRRVFMNNPG